MSRGIVIALAGLALISSVSSSEGSSIEACLRKDSISCVQIQVYKKLRALLSQDTINLLAGFQLVKDDTEQARSLPHNNTTDDRILSASDFSGRQSALEDFAYGKISDFFKERKFQWNVNPAVDQVTSTARSVIESIPGDMREKMTNLMTEGRGKRKLLKALIPILLAAKAKLAAFLGIAYVVTAIIAKKALLVSGIALAITLFLSIKKLLSKQHHYYPHHYEVHGEPYHGTVHHPVNNGWSGWDNSHDLHGAYSTASSHHLPYSAQKPSHRLNPEHHKI